MKKILIVLLILCSQVQAQKPTFVWADFVKSEGVDAFYSVAIDQNDNVYAVGYFDEDIIIANDTFYIPLSGNADVMFVKYDKNGNHIWTKQLGGIGPQECTEIIISSQDEIYIGGKIAGTSYMGDINGNPFYLYPTSGGYRSYVSKFNTNGDLIWSSLLDGTFNNWIWSIAFDINEDVMVVGHYAGTIFFNNGHSETEYHNSDIFIAKYNKNGICQWSMSEGGHDADWVYDIDVDSKNSFAISGAFDDTLNLSGNILIPNGDGDAFIAMYDSNQVLQWYYQAGGNLTGYVTPDAAEYVVFDSNDDLWVAGFFHDTIIFNGDSLFALTPGPSGGSDMFLVKFTNNGNIINSQMLGYPGSAYGDRPLDIEIDNQDNLYLTGAVANGFIIGDSTYYANGYSDLMIVQFDSTGKLNWLKQGGGSGYGESCTGIALNSNREIYFSGIISIGPTLTFDTITLSQTHLEYWYSGIIGKLSSITQTPTAVYNKGNNVESLNSYPNPSQDYIYIEGKPDNSLLEIYDIAGKQLYTNSIDLPGKVDVSSYKSGIYIFSFPELGESFRVVVR